MKKISFLLTLLSLSFSLVSCKSEEKTAPLQKPTQDCGCPHEKDCKGSCCPCGCKK